MKVTIISDGITGGAGLAALRLNNALRGIGVESTLLGVHIDHPAPNVERFERSMLTKLREHMTLTRHQRFMRRVLRQYPSTATFPFALYDITRHPVVQQADVINLHWVGNMLNYKTFFFKINKPVVWTLHDTNPFSGFSHFKTDLQGIPDNVLTAENNLTHLKASYIRAHGNLTIVPLCQWMKELSEASPTFKGYRHQIIRNSVNTEAFSPKDKQTAKRILDLDPDRPVLMFCCQYITMIRKGFDILMEALQHISQPLQLIVVGNMEDKKPPKNVPIRQFNSVKDELLMSILYNAADAFLLPSTEDNLPNTMLEALCCGTPVITFPICGMKDCIQDRVNGLFAHEVNAPAFARAIDDFLINKNLFDNAQIASEAHRLYDPATQARNYLNLYEEIV